MMENKEDILDALNEFEKKWCAEKSEIPPLLEQYLQQVSKTGITLFPWHKLKKLFLVKTDLVMTQFKEASPIDMLQTAPNVEPVKYEDMRKRILSLMEEFQGAPFTVQRLCELLLEPKRHYKRCDKFLRGIEKNVSVVTTVDPFGKKIASESQAMAMVNGLDSNGFNELFPKQNPFSSIPTPTQSAWSASVEKWFGTNNSNAESSKEGNNQECSGLSKSQDESLTEQELVDATEMETSNTSSTDEDTAVNSKSNESPHLDSSETENTGTSQKEEKTELHEEDASEITQSENVQDNEKTENKSISDQTENLNQSSEGLKSDETESVNDDSDKSSQALNICNNAQSILDSVNKACSEADETVSIAQKVCDTDQEQQSDDVSQPESNVENSTEQKEQSVEHAAEDSSCNSEQSKESDTTKQTSELQSECDTNKSDLSHKLPVCEEDSSSEAKKPKLSDSTDSESMDVDSNETVESNSALEKNNASSEQTDKENESEKVTQVKSSEDIPMEQD